MEPAGAKIKGPFVKRRINLSPTPLSLQPEGSKEGAQDPEGAGN